MSVTLPDAPARPTATHVPAPVAAGIEVPAWAWVVVAIATMWIAYALMGAAVAPAFWDGVHEFFHDGRHFLGVPCH